MMEIEIIEPQRKPLHIPVNLDEAPPEVVEVIQVIQKVAESILYHWEVFPIVLPPPLAVVTVTDGDGLNGKTKPFLIKDLFVAPMFEELDVVAMDSKGDPQLLSEQQLQSIIKTGEFEVESMNFPGQVHKWHLSQLLQKGTLGIKDTFFQDIAFSLRLLVITARNRLFSHFFSVSQSLRAFCQGLAILLDAFAGIPSLSVSDLDVRLQEDRSKYLVAELTVKTNVEEDIDNLCQFVKHQIRKHTKEKNSFRAEKSPPVTYVYQTPKGHEVDLRLFCKAIMCKAIPLIASILEKESRGWFLPFREKIIAELKMKRITEEEVERQANILVLDEYFRRVSSTINLHPQLQELGHGIGCLLVDQARSVIFMHRAVDNMHRRLSQTLAQLKRSLKSTYPVLSYINPWVDERLKVAQEEFMIEHQWDAHEEALALCRQNHLEQASYFIYRDLTFMREREPVLKQELSRVRNPNRTFYWRTQIWFPHHWKVRKVFQGESDIIPTVINSTSLSLSQLRSDPNQPVYLVEKQCSYTTTTRNMFWRWINYCFRTFSWLWNVMFLFAVVIPWCSPIGLRALFYICPFMPDLEINQLDGTLYPRKSSITHTLCSRLIMLWRHISKSRTEFESRPDTGFIGKGLSRHLNRLWNYLVKGALGTLATVLLFPTACLLISGLSLCIAFTAPVWVPGLALLFHLSMIVIYDFDSPSLSRNKACIIIEALLWYIILQGLLQPILALCVALFVCPITSVIIFFVAIFRWCLRFVWDVAIFNLIIKKRGRVPASDSCLVKRISGPGLTNGHYFQIQPEQALAAFEAKLETEELNAFREEVEKIILLPQQTYSEFFHQCFHPFSAKLCKDGAYKQLEIEAQNLFTVLRDQVDGRKKELQTGLNIKTRSKIKLTCFDLQVTIYHASSMLEAFYPTHVFKRMQFKEEDFWDRKGLSFRDWTGLAAQMLTEIFSPDFLIPLEDSDIRYRLEARGINLSRYSEMLKPLHMFPGIDVSRLIHTPKGKMQIHSPYLDLNVFNPLSSASSTVCKKNQKRICYPWKRKQRDLSAEKLVIPLPIPHPVEISVIIFNRENEDPITMDSELCKDIFQAIEDGAKVSTMFSFNSHNSPTYGQSLTSLGKEYQSLASDFEIATIDSENNFSCNSHESLSDHQNHHVSGSIIVNLASSEDLTLEPDGQRVTYSHSSYSTTV